MTHSTNRSRPVTIEQFYTKVGASVDRTLNSVRILVLTFYKASSPLYLIVRAVRAAYIVFGSHSSKSTKFGTNVAQAILFRFLKGAKTSDPWSRHIGKFNMAAKQIEG